MIEEYAQLNFWKEQSNKSDHTNSSSEDKWIRTQTVGSHSGKVELRVWLFGRWVINSLEQESLLMGNGCVKPSVMLECFLS